MKEQVYTGGGTLTRDMLREILAVPSYSVVGYWMRKRRWDPTALQVDMTGRVCVVTGASRGLGFATARALTRMGSTVVMVCRDLERGAQACRTMSEVSAGQRVVLDGCDLASVSAVRDFAERFTARFPRLDVLINNAGASFGERQCSVDGHEMTFATNVLGGFHLTRLLLPHLLVSAPSRIVHVGSAAQYVARLDTGALIASKPPYRRMRSYAHSKRAVAELNALWAKRLAGTSVTSNLMHPGLSATPGVTREFPHYSRWCGPILRDIDQGADTIVWLAAARAAAAETGKVWFDRQARPPHILPWTQSPSGEAERLWEACSASCGLPAAIGGVW